MRIGFVTGAADTREAALVIAGEFRDLEAIDRAFTTARARCHADLREVSLTPGDVALFDRLAAAVVFTTPGLRRPEAVAANRLGQPGLWPHAISGDLPIVLVRVATVGDESVVRQLVQWRTHVRRRGLELDLVILDERDGEAAQRLRTELQTGAATASLGKPGGIFVLAADRLSSDDAVLLAAAARAVLGGGRGSLADQLDHRPTAPPPLPPLLPSRSIATDDTAEPAKEPEGMLFWNGFGGFTGDGREYVIKIDGTPAGGPALPPAPWTNVLANPGFGCLVTEAGLGYSWAGNSQMNRLTPWSNDPGSDPPSEVIYLRDEETGEVWTPTPLPCGPRAAVTVRHGQGFTRYTHVSRKLDQDVLRARPDRRPGQAGVPHPAKQRRQVAPPVGDFLCRMGARHRSAAERLLQVVCRAAIPETGAVLARNAWAGSFAGQIAFLAAGPSVQGVTADRTEFLGCNGSVSAPAALGRVGPSGRASGALLDPAAAVMTNTVLAPGEATELVFVLGQAESLEQVTSHRRLHRRRSSQGGTGRGATKRWDHLLNAVQVKTARIRAWT